jgi:TLC domain
MTLISLQPCVYIRWVLYKLKKTDSMAYVVNGMAMLLAFFLTRNVFGLGALDLRGAAHGSQHASFSVITVTTSAGAKRVSFLCSDVG